MTLDASKRMTTEKVKRSSQLRNSTTVVLLTAHGIVFNPVSAGVLGTILNGTTRAGQPIRSEPLGAQKER